MQGALGIYPPSTTWQQKLGAGSPRFLPPKKWAQGITQSPHTPFNLGARLPSIVHDPHVQKVKEVNPEYKGSKVKKMGVSKRLEIPAFSNVLFSTHVRHTLKKLVGFLVINRMLVMCQTQSSSFCGPGTGICISSLHQGQNSNVS